MLEGFERAFALAEEWNGDAQAATEAEVQAILDYGNSSSPDENGIEPINVTACELSQMNEAGSCQPR